MSSRSDVLKVGNVTYTYYPVNRVAGHEKLPFSLTVLLENILRNAESDERASELAQRLVEAGLSGEVGSEIEFSPARVLFQDFTGVPVFSAGTPKPLILKYSAIWLLTTRLLPTKRVVRAHCRRTWS